jgi:hypothetical protein
MAISIVNGFVCTSSCDVAKAKKGEDPHPLTGAAKIAAEREEAANDPLKADDPRRAADPAVVYGGALAELSQTRTVQPVEPGRPTDRADLRTQGLAVDLLV